METSQGKKYLNHDWFVALITFIASAVASLILYSYGQGQQEHRIQTLEKQMVDMREDWKEARARIERALKEKQ